jgi:hypothetical protein
VKQKPETKIIQLTKMPIEAVREAIEGQKYAQERKRELRESFDQRADVQEHRRLTRDEKVRRAKELMIGRVREFNDAMQGRETTRAEAERKVDELTRRFARENGDE